MSFEDRLRDHLQDKGETIIPPPTPIDAVETKGRRRKMRNRVGGSVAALAVFAGGGVLLTNQSGNEPDSQVTAIQPAVTTTQAPQAAAELTYREVAGPDLGENQTVTQILATDDGYVAIVDEWTQPEMPSIDEIMAALPAELAALLPEGDFSTADELFSAAEGGGISDQFFNELYSTPGLSDLIFPSGTQTTSVHRSVDGEVWELSEASFASSGYIQQIEYYDGNFYMLTGDWNETAGAESFTVIQTSDFETLTTLELPQSVETTEDYVDQYTSIYQLDVGPNGIVVGGQTSMNIDLYKLVPEEYSDYSYSLNWTDTGIDVRQYAEQEFFDGPVPVEAFDDVEQAFAQEDTATTEITLEAPVAPTEPPINDEFPIPVEPDWDYEGELITSFTWAELGVDETIVDDFMYGHRSGSIIWHAPLGGDFSGSQELGDSDMFDIIDLVATDAGFLAIGNGWDESGTGGNLARIWTSTNGSDWSINTAASASFGNSDFFSGIASLGDRLVIVGTCEGNAVAWVSTDGGTFWIMHPLDDVVDAVGSNNFGLDQNASGSLGMIAIATVWGDFGDDMVFPNMEPVELTKDGYTMVMEFETFTMSLIGSDGEVIHDRVSMEELDGDGSSIDGVLTTNADDDLTFLDPETGEALVTFTSEEGEAATAEAIPAEQFLGEESFEEGEFSAPDRHILFTADGSNWSSTNASELGLVGDWWANAVAVSDNEVVIAVQQFGEYDFESEVEPTQTTKFFIGTLVE